MATASATSTASPSDWDYLQTLGVDAIWIAPMFPSPQVDFGYDISDYESVDPQYGTSRISTTRRRGPQTWHPYHPRYGLEPYFDQHKWFIEACRVDVAARNTTLL